MKAKSCIVESALSYKILGTLFRVHKQLGGSYHERYYSRALEIALKKENIQFEKEVPINLKFDGQPIGTCRVDFVINGKVLLEIKAIPSISSSELKQVFAYLKATGLRLGIIANFRGEKLTYRRLINNRRKKLR